MKRLAILSFLLAACAAGPASADGVKPKKPRLDLRAAPAFLQHAPPQGYFHLPASAAGGPGPDMLATVLKLRDMVGEFEKPRFFVYRQKLCAHSRNETVGWDELERLKGGDHWSVGTVHTRLDEGNSPWNDYEASRTGLAAAMKALGFRR